MNKFKSHFVFTKSQQNGIFLLVIIIIILQLILFFFPFSSEGEAYENEEEIVKQFQKEIDSLKKVAAEKDSLPLSRFNPNFITDFRGYRLGLSVAEIDRLHDYRAEGRYVNSPEEFQQVTGVSDSLLQLISPAFEFPVFSRVPKLLPKKEISQVFDRKDLNSATAEDLRRVNGIGEVLSQRIIRYRESLGGFRAAEQVRDVYGLSPEVVEKLLLQFSVPEKDHEKLDLNAVDVLRLAELPYFNFELARAVIQFRNSRNGIRDFEDLREVKDFPQEKIERIKLYLRID